MKGVFANIQAHRFFLLCAVVLGIAYNLCTPPLQAPDEWDHFRRAIHVSYGHFLPEKKDQRLGGDIPRALDEFIVPYRLTAFNLRYTLNREQIAESFKVPFSKGEFVFQDFPNTSYYSPVSYAPQAMAIFILRKMSASAAVVFYGARIITYLIWAFCLFFLIRGLPAFQWLFTFLALLPMHVYISNSLSADVVTNILAFAFVSLVLKFAFEGRAFTLRRMMLLALVGGLLALSKLVYGALALTIFIIPASKCISRKQFLFFTGAVIFITTAAGYLWSSIIMHYYTPYTEYNPVYRDYCCVSRNASIGGQTDYILSHGGYFIRVIMNSIFRHPQLYLKGYIGIFGPNDNPLPGAIVYPCYAVILLVALFSSKVRLSRNQKLLLLFSATAVFLLLLISQHLTWDDVGEDVVDLIQGRYLIPVFLLIFLCFTGFFIIRERVIALIVIAAVFILNAISLRMVYGRYFKETSLSKTEFTCGAEEMNNGMFVTSDKKITLENADTRSDSSVHSGKYSVRISADKPYGLTWRFKGLSYGDLVEVSAWAKGEASIVISGKGKTCDEFFLPSSGFVFEKEGWKKMNVALTITEKCSATDSVGAAIFVWNPNKNAAWIDDIRVCVKKFGSGDYIEVPRKLFE